MFQFQASAKDPPSTAKGIPTRTQGTAWLGIHGGCTDSTQPSQLSRERVRLPPPAHLIAKVLALSLIGRTCLWGSQSHVHPAINPAIKVLASNGRALNLIFKGEGGLVYQARFIIVQQP